MNRRIILVILLATILVLAFVSSALAKKPDVVTFIIPPEPFTFDCDEFGYTGFDVITVDDVTIKITTFFNNDGNPKEFQAFVKIDGIIFRSDKPEQTYKDMARITSKGELPFDEVNDASAGISWNITVPGKGTVAFRVGRIIYDENGVPEFSAGPGTDKSAAEVVCDGFAEL